MAANEKFPWPRESRSAKRARAGTIHGILGEMFPDAVCALRHQNAFQLLIAVMLSAQTTDVGVNRATPALFERFPDAHSLANASQEDVESLIRSLGFFRQKARSLRETAAALVAEHDGVVPRTMEELTALRGVGRKTANVVLGECFEPVGVVVDTHVRRISRRLALTRSDDPVRIERDLMDLLPPSAWRMFSHRVIWHGRGECPARKPRCQTCPLLPHCPTGTRALKSQPRPTDTA